MVTHRAGYVGNLYNSICNGRMKMIFTQEEMMAMMQEEQDKQKRGEA